MFGIVAMFLVAFAPGVFWMWLIYRWDRYQPEPRWLIVRTFLWGMAIVIPLAFIELMLMYGQPVFSLGQMSVAGIAYQAFVVAGMTEELGKFLVIRLAIYKSFYFDESTDGIVYASAVALGFASLENFGYTLSYGWQVILTRGPISTLAHVLFSVIWGYPLALMKIRHPRARLYVWLGLIGAMVAHGFFDFFLFTQRWYAVLSIPLLIGLAIALNRMLRHSRSISIYRDKVAEAQVNCANCSGNVPAYARFCPACGRAIDRRAQHSHFNCGKCGTTLSADSKYCTACGSRITTKPRQE